MPRIIGLCDSTGNTVVCTCSPAEMTRLTSNPATANLGGAYEEGREMESIVVNLNDQVFLTRKPIVKGEQQS